MFFLRGLWKQKPQAWGPASLVSKCLYDRIGNKGINPYKIACASPCWSTGLIDYGPWALPCTVTGYKRTNEGLLSDGSSSIFFLGNDKLEISDSDFTFLIRASSSNVIRAKNYFSSQYDLAGKRVVRCQAGWTTTTTIVNRPFLLGDETGNWVLSEYTISSGINITTTEDYAFVKRDTTKEIYIDKTGYATISGGEPIQINVGQGYNIGMNLPIGDVLKHFLYIKQALPTNIIHDLKDNPYQLWQQPAFRAYSLPSGTPTIFNIVSALHAVKPTRMV